MQGYKLEFKRNCDCGASLHQAQKLVPLGYVDAKDVADVVEGGFSTDCTPRSTLERAADQILPPPRGQDVRAPIDGVSTLQLLSFGRWGAGIREGFN